MRRFESLLASVATDVAMVDVAVPYDTPFTLDPERGGRYVLQELIALGPRSWVYLADDRRLSTDKFAARVVVKIARDAAASGSPEAELARQIEHPDVPAVLDRGVTALGHHYVVLEWVDGTSLSEVTVPWRGAGVRRAVTFIARLGRILESAHAKGIVHCDLKPDNVHIGLDAHEGRPLLLDFDLAITQGDTPDGRTRGNLGFMAPEQLTAGSAGDATIVSEALTPQADVYALGGLLVYLLTGRPVNGVDVAEARASLLAKRHWPEGGSPGGASGGTGTEIDVADSTLLAIIRRAVEPETTRRYRSMSQFVTDLDRWLASEPIEWQRPSLARRARLWSRRRPLLAAATLTGVLLSAGAIAGGFAWQNARARAEADRITAEAQRQQEILRQVNERTTAELERLRAAGRAQIRQTLFPLLTRAPGGQGEQLVPAVYWISQLIEAGGDLYGDQRLGQPERLDALRAIEANNRQAGQDDSVPQLLTRLAIAELLVHSGRAGEAVETTGQIRGQWQGRLNASDPLLPMLDAIDLAAKVALAPPDKPVDPAEIAAVRERLQAADVPSSYLRILDRLEKPPAGGR
ncbi:MAG: hypothetical protein MUE97_06160 [Phycisphaerales bacterium]|nr:hypothetical protein [Phycisphaerales bacterium]